MNTNTPNGSFETLEEFVTTGKQVVTTGQDLDEANTKAKLITPLIRTLGWRVHDNDEVLLEYAGDGFDKQVDYALFGPSDVHAVVEAKSIGRGLGNHETQIRQYMKLFEAEWGLLTNGQQVRIFRETEDGGPIKIETTDLPNLSSSSYLQAFSRQSVYSEDIGDKNTDASPRISEETKREIIEISDEQRLYELFIESIAPGVYGYERHKLAIVLSLFGGVTKQLPDEEVIRGSPHMLFVSDPGIPINEITKYAARVSPQSVHLSNGASPGELLKSRDLPNAPDPEDVSDHSASTIAGTTHAVISQLEQIDEDHIERLNGAFTSEITNDANANESLIETTGVIATSKPKYGQFDQYEPISEQIDLPSTLVTGFDLIFVLTDEADREQDHRRAEHVLNTNYVGELEVQQEEMSSPEVNRAEVDAASGEVAPPVGPELLQKYIAYSKRNCHPRMTEEAREAIQEFYTNLRSKASDEGAPVPITARKLEAIVRLAEASARVRLSNEVTQADADRVIEIVRSCLTDLGVHFVSEEVDSDVETSPSIDQRDRAENIKTIVEDAQDEFGGGAPVDIVLERANEMGMSQKVVKSEIEKLKHRGELYEPNSDHFRTT